MPVKHSTYRPIPLLYSTDSDIHKLHPDSSEAGQCGS